MQFFERVRQGYQRRMELMPQRFARIDAAADQRSVALQIEQLLLGRQW